MVIKIDIDSNMDAVVNRLQQSLVALPQTLEQEVLDVASDYEQRILADLGAIPAGRAKHPFRFGTPKSRRYYFYMVRTGMVKTDGYGYVRSGRLPMGWYVDVNQDSDGTSISVGNKWRASMWIYGTQSRDTRVAGHRNTGWEYAKPKADKWIGIMQKDLIDRIIKRIGRL